MTTAITASPKHRARPPTPAGGANDALLPIRAALEGGRYETARRLCRQALDQDAAPRFDLLQVLHEVTCALGDLGGARTLMLQAAPASHDERLEVALLLAEDYQRLAQESFYRNSEEAQAGLCVDEYVAKYQRLAEHAFAEALALADTPARRARADALRHRYNTRPPAAAAPPPVFTVAATTGVLKGTLRFADGRPVAAARVVLGFPLAITGKDPATHLEPGLDGSILPTVHAAQGSLSTSTDAEGRFCLKAVPAQRHDFLAVQLDPEQHDQALHFVAQNLCVAANAETCLDLVLEPWTSAPAHVVTSPFAARHLHQGHSCRKLAEWPLHNPFHFDFPRQMVSLPLPAGAPAAESLLLLCSTAPERPLPLQVSGGQLLCFAELPACSEQVLALYAAPGPQPPPPAELLRLTPEPDGHTAILETGRARFRLAWGETPATPPLLAVSGEDGVWRGQGRFVLPAGTAIVGQTTRLLESGPLQLVVETVCQLSQGSSWRLRLTAHAGQPYLLAHEVSPELAGAAFEFSLREFSGGRGFLHWTPEHGNVHWTSLTAADRELARLQESVAWWIPPQGFGYAMTADGLAERDYIGVFTRRRGEWIDRAFERIAQGPGDDRREWDWPFPEMVGSTISMITAHTSPAADAWFRFGFFDGERHWGLLVSTLERNDGPFKEISAIQHQTSSPRLEQFLHWRLDEQDHGARPHVLTRPDRLRTLRARRDSPLFALSWQTICEGNRRHPARGLRALVDADPGLAWRLKREMLAELPVRARMTLLGRDYADVYSPVGGRDITPTVEQYDLIAATGVFTPAEERLVRACFMLCGHMFMEKDFMNWGYNSRNANFEADRVDIVGTIGLVFRGNPDADGFVQHALDGLERSLEVYSTPGSGKWYENPACYYLRSATCRLNLAYHLYEHGLLDPVELPRLRDFMRWGVLLLTPPYPEDHDVLRDGTPAWDTLPRHRHIPPVGDHAQLGRSIGEFYALMARAYRPRDPAFADFLMWAYQQGRGAPTDFSRHPLFFAAMAEEDLRPAPPQTLASRRLEGFGAVLRGHFNQPNEFYLLFKQGPGGYRYHRTEGSIILFANGKPLVFDGGEAGETWRHSTLSFHATHMPLAPGHVERCRFLPALELVQGVHPRALSPGEPIYLSDLCEHRLVEVACQRFAEPHPADVRCVLWVKDQYLILHDDLNLPAATLTHWHLQVVADAHHYAPTHGYRFTGRFGTDLQVLLPGLAGAREEIAQVPIHDYVRPAAECFAQRHLQLSLESPRRIAAVLRPLAGAAAPVVATADGDVLHVHGDGLDDTLVFAREDAAHSGHDWQFSGRYAALLRRPDSLTLALLAGTRLAAAGLELGSDGPAVSLTLGPQGASLDAQGEGTVSLLAGDRRLSWQVPAAGLAAVPIPGLSWPR